jgi:hypothetical protein
MRKEWDGKKWMRTSGVGKEATGGWYELRWISEALAGVKGE